MSMWPLLIATISIMSAIRNGMLGHSAWLGVSAFNAGLFLAISVIEWRDADWRKKP